MSRLIHAVVSLSLVLAAGACGPRGGTEAPGGAGGATAGAQQHAGVQLRYALAPAALVQTATFDMRTSGGGQFGEATLQFTAALELAPKGEQLQVVWSIVDVGELETKGMFAAPDDAPGEVKTLLVAEGKGAFLVDARGQLDEDASNGLAQNVARRERVAKLQTPAKRSAQAKPGGGVQLLAFADAMIAVPDLPAPSLELGKPVAVDEDEQTELGGSGTVLPTAKHTEYTLVKIDDSGGKRIAELQVEAVSSGAAETADGMLGVEITTAGVLLFDLDAQLPVSYRYTRSQTITLGEATFESTMMLEASFAGA